MTIDINFNSFFSKEASLRGASVMALPSPGTISLSTGLPNPECFPLKGVHIDVQSPASDFNKTEEITRTIDLHPDEIVASCQYLSSKGLKFFNEWVTNYVTTYFKPDYQDWNFLIQAGATQSLDALFRMLLDPGEDTILCENFTYSCFLETCVPMRIEVVSTEMDSEGIIPSKMDSLLENWNSCEKTKSLKFPKLLYTMPTGHNPTGITLSTERRRELLEVANKHNILIIEDDPYYHLQLDNDENSEHIPSLLKFDTQGRVIRIDSFSKMLMPGLRVSVVTANSTFIKKLTNHNELSIHSASAVSQLMLQMIFTQWGDDGYHKWLDHLQSLYRRRRDIMVSSFDKYLPHDLVAFNRPNYGMFIWIDVHLEKFPQPAESSMTDAEWAQYVEDEIFRIAAEDFKVVLTKGHWFMHDKSLPKAGFRATYSYSEEESMIKGAEAFGKAIMHAHAVLTGN